MEEEPDLRQPHTLRPGPGIRGSRRRDLVGLLRSRSARTFRRARRHLLWMTDHCTFTVIEHGSAMIEHAFVRIESGIDAIALTPALGKTPEKVLPMFPV